MNFYKLSPKHKRQYIITQAIVFGLILLMFIIAMNIQRISIVNNSDSVRYTFGFIMLFGVLLLASANRLKTLFKVKFIGFLTLFIIVLLLESILSTITLGLGLMLIPLAIDDLIFKPIWHHIWYNNYE